MAIGNVLPKKKIKNKKSVYTHTHTHTHKKNLFVFSINKRNMRTSQSLLILKHHYRETPLLEKEIN
jgi:hypothetical protein